MTPNGQAAMQARQPLHTSDWITTVSNSVRMMAPVGHTSRQPACTQCLHTSLIISQRPSYGPLNCSMKRTCRQWMPSSRRVLSCLSPDSSRTPPFSAGSWFHSLHATSHALQPMQTVVSVKNPMASGISRLLHVADESLAFVDRHVRVPDPGREVVDDVAGREPHPPPVPRHADVMNGLARDLHHADAIGHQRFGAHVSQLV